MSRLDRWFRSGKRRCSQSVATDRRSDLVETKAQSFDVAAVANVARWENRKGRIRRSSDPSRDLTQNVPLATSATNPNRPYKNNQLAEAARWLHTGYKRQVGIDFETCNRGGCDLKDAGAWRYAADPATDIITAVYQEDGIAGDLLWTPGLGNLVPLAIFASLPEVQFVCFAGFEQAIWQHIMVERFGFPPIPIERWVDMQAVCSYFALPRSLDKALAVIGASTTKDAAGARLVRSLSRIDRKTGLYPAITPAILKRVEDYNRTDVAGAVDLFHALGELPERERQVWELDQRINQGGSESMSASSVPPNRLRKPRLRACWRSLPHSPMI